MAHLASRDELELIDGVENIGNLAELRILLDAVNRRRKQVLFVTATGRNIVELRKAMVRLLSVEATGLFSVVSFKTHRSPIVDKLFNWAFVPEWDRQGELASSVGQRELAGHPLLTPEEDCKYRESLDLGLFEIKKVAHSIRDIGTVFLDDVYTLGLIPLLRKESPNLRIFWVNHRYIAECSSIAKTFLLNCTRHATGFLGWSEVTFPPELRAKVTVMALGGINPFDLTNSHLDAQYVEYVMAKHRISPERPRILQLGRLVLVKDFFLTLRAFSRLRQMCARKNCAVVMPQLICAFPLGTETQEGASENLSRYLDHLVAEKLLERDDVALVGLSLPGTDQVPSVRDIKNAQEFIRRMSVRHQNDYGASLLRTTESLDTSERLSQTDVNHLEVNALQTMAHVGVHCSLLEAFGMVITEQLWKGIPTIASTAGGIPAQYPTRELREFFLIRIDCEYENGVREAHRRISNQRYDAANQIFAQLGGFDPAEALAQRMFDSLALTSEERRTKVQALKDHVRQNYLVLSSLVQTVRLCLSDVDVRTPTPSV
jgi:glycosyltransferase involved in cell wall biosynthesis